MIEWCWFCSNCPIINWDIKTRYRSLRCHTHQVPQPLELILAPNYFLVKIYQLLKNSVFKETRNSGPLFLVWAIRDQRGVSPLGPWVKILIFFQRRGVNGLKKYNFEKQVLDVNWASKIKYLTCAKDFQKKVKKLSFFKKGGLKEFKKLIILKK